MKKLKNIILLCFIFSCFLLGSGFDWKYHYQYIQPECTYTLSTTDENQEKIGFDKITIKMAPDGAYFKTSNTGYIQFYDSSKSKNLFTYYSLDDYRKIYFENFNAENFANYYLDHNAKCPGEINAIINPDGDYYPSVYLAIFYPESDPSEFNFVPFYAEIKDPVVSGNDGKKCMNPDAASCNHYTKTNLPDFNGDKKDVYIEIGKLTNGNNYLGVANNSDFGDIKFSSVEPYTVVTSDNDVFNIQDDAVFNNINDIYLYSQESAGHNIFWIKSSGGDDYGDAYTNGGPTGPNIGGVKLFGLDLGITRDCDSYLGNPINPNSPAHYLQFIFNLMKYAAIIMLFVFTIIEFVKATASNNQDAIKKAMQNTIKRIIIVIVLFMLPELIKFILTVLGAYSPGTCSIK